MGHSHSRDAFAWRRHLWMFGALVVALGLVLAPKTGAIGSRASTAVQTSCTSSYCYWGYNYVGSNLNNPVYTPTSNFYQETMVKNSGGAMYEGFGPSGCHVIVGDNGTFTYTPGQLGCSATGNSAFVQYDYGASSYLHFQAPYN